MSKGKVWNRGKHNGRGLPPRKDKEPVAKSEGSNPAEGSGLSANTSPTRVNTVQRMNRENWVQRATPVKREDRKE